MALRVIGAGLGRTGTLSLKVALEKLLGAPCYHMTEVFAHPEHVALWHGAARGTMPDWEHLFQGYAATADWPSASFWPELCDVYPDALVVLSVRDADSWWRSASSTIFPTSRAQQGEWRDMVDAVFAARFTSDLDDGTACVDAFERHNARVRAAVPAGRLLEWRAGDGWAPLCGALDLPVPDGPFPHTNSTEEFLSRLGSK
jgi:hypothetical protein